MTDAEQRLEVVRKAGEVGLGLVECDTPPVSRYTPEDDDGVPLLQEDDRYWNAWTRIRDLVDGFDDHTADVEQRRDEPVPYCTIHAYQKVDGEEFATVGAVYGADGESVINVEFKLEDGWRASINDYQRNLTPLAIGRQIAAAELAVLANKLESPAETLDYWMTQTLYSTQSSWAKDRKASSQTVSDRVRAAKEKLDLEDE